MEPSPWATIVATARKELQIARRYVPNLVGRLAELGVRLAFFFLLSNIVSVNAEDSPLGREIAGRDLAIFFEGALVLFVFNATALSAPVDAVRTDLLNGTIDYIFSCPTSRYGYFLGTVVASGLIDMVVFLPMFVVLVVYSQSTLVNTLLILAVCLVVLVTIVAFGVMIALLALLWRQVGSIVQVIGILFELLAGAYFPVAAFPAPLLYLAGLLPYTWGYDLIRYYSFDRAWDPLLPVPLEWAILVGYAIVFTGLSRVLLRRTESRAKEQGLHLI
jgi:ABC-2 type transport system permease protein